MHHRRHARPDRAPTRHAREPVLLATDDAELEPQTTLPVAAGSGLLVERRGRRA